MRKLLCVSALVFALNGCASTGTGTGPTPADVIAEARNIAVAACGFLPAVSTVAGILAAGNPALTTASAVASAICAAVTAPAAARGTRIPTVNGVPVQGSFVK